MEDSLFRVQTVLRPQAKNFTMIRMTEFLPFLFFYIFSVFYIRLVKTVIFITWRKRGVYEQTMDDDLHGE